jgi:hypothetical protein
MDIWTSTGLTNSFLRRELMARVKTRKSRTSKGIHGKPHGGNGTRDGLTRLLNQLDAHLKEKHTKAFNPTTGDHIIRDSAGNIVLPKTFKKGKNAKSSS